MWKKQTAAPRIIVGLGNPGDEYRYTRHNVGFETIDKLAYDYKVILKYNKKFRAHTGQGRIGSEIVLLIKPNTYMNLSGESVSAIIRFYKIPPEEVIVIYDDINLPVGEIRVREKGSAGGQKGMVNIIRHLGTDEFPRVRIGIGAKPEGWDLADYVTSRCTKEEWEALIPGVIKAGDAAVMLLTEDVPLIMGQFNKKNPCKEDK